MNFFYIDELASEKKFGVSETSIGGTWRVLEHLLGFQFWDHIYNHQQCYRMICDPSDKICQFS